MGQASCTHESDCIVAIESEVQQTDQGEQVADMEGTSGRVDAEVDGDRLLDVLARGSTVLRVSSLPSRSRDPACVPGQLGEHSSLFEFADDVPSRARRSEGPRSMPACW